MSNSTGITAEITPVRPADVSAIVLLARVIWQHAYAGMITQKQIDYMLAQRYNAPPGVGGIRPSSQASGSGFPPAT